MRVAGPRSGFRHRPRLKRGNVVVIVGHGRVIDEGALIDELDTGRVRAALLDVFADEPLPEDLLLWQLDDVMITAHAAGMSPHYDRCRSY